MRSEQVYRALNQGLSRFAVCQLVSKSVRRLHKPGARFQDTINYTLVHINPAPEAYAKIAANDAPPLKAAA